MYLAHIKPAAKIAEGSHQRILNNGEWRMDNGEWRVDNGEWRVDNGEFSLSLI
jgi:hypothetical protein